MCLSSIRPNSCFDSSIHWSQQLDIEGSNIFKILTSRFLIQNSNKEPPAPSRPAQTKPLNVKWQKLVAFSDVMLQIDQHLSTVISHLHGFANFCDVYIPVSYLTSQFSITLVHCTSLFCNHDAQYLVSYMHVGHFESPVKYTTTRPQISMLLLLFKFSSETRARGFNQLSLLIIHQWL